MLMVLVLAVLWFMGRPDTDASTGSSGPKKRRELFSPQVYGALLLFALALAFLLR